MILSRSPAQPGGGREEEGREEEGREEEETRGGYFSYSPD